MRIRLRHAVTCGNVVLVAEQVLDVFWSNTCTAIALRLPEDLATVLGVGVVAEVGPFVEEAAPVEVHDEAEGVGVLLVQLGDGAVAEGTARSGPKPRRGNCSSVRGAWLRCRAPCGCRRRCCMACRAPSPAPSRGRGSGSASRRSPRNHPQASTTARERRCPRTPSGP